jgi:hypothetical protein
MKEETFKRLLSLIEKTGDRLVITDPAGESPYVLMGLDHYEKLVVGEWKPEVMKREPPPPQTLPLSTTFPDNKPPKREIPLWKLSPTTSPGAPSTPPPGPRLAQDRPRIEEKPAPAPARPPEPPKTPPPTPKTVENAVQEPEGEEQFYLEPLE